MNETQLRRCLRVGIVVLGLIPILQTCYMGWCGYILSQRHGTGFLTIHMDPPMLCFQHPFFAVVYAILLAVWCIVLVSRKSAGMVHVCLYQIAMFFLIIQLYRDISIVSEIVTECTFYTQSQDKTNTPNQSSEATPKPSAPQ